jgi:hypothetical protein
VIFAEDRNVKEMENHGRHIRSVGKSYAN